MGRHKIMLPETVLQAIRECTRYEIVAIPPTMEKIRRKLGIGSTRTVYRYILDLEKSGRIKRVGGKLVHVLNPGEHRATLTINDETDEKIQGNRR